MPDESDPNGDAFFDEQDRAEDAGEMVIDPATERLAWPDQMLDPKRLTERLYATTDAMVWAEEFMRVVRAGATLDEGLMVGWFANAMATAESHARAKVLAVLGSNPTLGERGNEASAFEAERIMWPEESDA